MPAAYDGDLVFVDRSGEGLGHPLAFRCMISERDLGSLWQEQSGLWRWRYLGGTQSISEVRGSVTSREAAMLAVAEAYRHSSPEASDRMRMQYRQRLNSPEGTYPII